MNDSILGEDGSDMKVGVLITSIGNFGQKGFYNSQEIGLARELDRMFDKVIVYKAIPEAEKRRKSLIKGCKRSILYQIPVKRKGINGIWDCSIMDPTLNALIYFSDTQLSVPSIYKWCCQHSVKLYPYIGVIESHSTNRIKRFLIDRMFQRNLMVYKKCTCFVKTPAVEKKLKSKGIKKCIMAPVGLDLELLYQHYENISVVDLKKKYGYQKDDKVLLFIGRMTEEKRPLSMVEIFKKIYKKDQNYHLLMVGKGELLKAVKESAKEMGKNVQFLEQVPNKDIWELYRIADAFINLNRQEIFGMVILEAMFYGCTVIALRAPGPNYIIQDEVSGYLADSDEEIVERILGNRRINSKEYILSSFTWTNTVQKMKGILDRS